MSFIINNALSSATLRNNAFDKNYALIFDKFCENMKMQRYSPLISKGLAAKPLEALGKNLWSLRKVSRTVEAGK
jgi:hypothetical protein